MLEHTIAAVFLEIAYLATGLLLCFLGKSLLEKGITGGFQGEGAVASTRFRVVTSSPGLVFALVGLVVISTAIVTPAIYREGKGTGDKEDETTLESLADTVRVSILAQSSPEVQFAHAQFDTSARLARNGDIPAAVTYMVRAIVVHPEFLRRALESPDLAAVVRDPIFESIIRERFKLPLELEAASSLMNHPIFVHLRIYIFATRSLGEEASEDVTNEMSKIPARPQMEPEEATLGRLKLLLSKNPRALLNLLEDPKYSWLLQNDTLVASLRARIDELIGQMGAMDLPKGKR